MHVNPFMQLRQVRFVGPSGVGKTAALAALTDFVRREPAALTVIGSSVVSVSEVGEWEAPGGAVVSVVAATEQEIPKTAVPLGSLPRAAATVLWLYGDQPHPTQRWLQALVGQRSTGTLTVVVTRASAGPVVRDIESLVRSYDRNIPIVFADPRERLDVARVMQTALRDSFGFAASA